MASKSTSPRALKDATENSATVWLTNLEDLFHQVKERYPDVVWEFTAAEGDENQVVEEVWGHKAIIYARTPPSLQNRYITPRPEILSASPIRSPSGSFLFRLNTSLEPALFSNELRYLYTGKGFDPGIELLFGTTEGGGESNIHDIQIEKLRKDLVFMWHSRLYSDVRITVTGNVSTRNHQNTTAIFSSHRFVLISRSPYFRTVLVPSPSTPKPSTEPLTLALPSPPFSPASLHFTLGFIYTGTLVFSRHSYDLDTAFRIMLSAKYLSLQTLYDEIQARIVQEMMHGLFHAFLDYPEYERLKGGEWGTGGCRCKQCARRAPRVLEFALSDAVQNGYLDRGSRRALVNLFGEGWCTRDFAALPAKLRDSLLKGVRKMTTPGNVFALLFATEYAMGKLSTIIDAWVDVVREMILAGRKGIDDCLASKSEDCFVQPDWIELMEADGVRFGDEERVEWVMTSVRRGMNEKNAAVLYQTLISLILLRPHPTGSGAAMLSSTSPIRIQVEQTRIDVLQFMRENWMGIRQEGGFGGLETWALKEIGDVLEIPVEDLLMPPASAHTGTTTRGGLKLPLSKPNDRDALSCMASLRVSVLNDASDYYKRIHKELLEGLPEGLAIYPLGDLLHFRGMIEGPASSPYESGLFQISLEYTIDPLGHPKASFQTKIYHPNVNSDGGIRASVLREEALPLPMSKVLLSIFSLLSVPDLEDPLVPEIANIYIANRLQFERRAREWTKRYASRSVIKSSVQTVTDPVDLTGTVRKLGEFAEGHGGYGDVWSCVWNDMGKTNKVAVKVVRSNNEDPIHQKTVIQRLSRELHVWNCLDHPHVLRLYGICRNFGPLPAMISPWMPNGNLTSFLRLRSPNATLLDRLLLLCQVASGLQYLHASNPPVVHGDLKAANILIDDQRQACISDFGLSRLLDVLSGGNSMTSNFAGSVRWMSPELLVSDSNGHLPRPTVFSDMYAFGGLMHEALTDRLPYHNIRHDAQVLIIINNGGCPDRPDDVSIQDSHWNHMQECWSKEPRMRPTIGSAWAQLEFLKLSEQSRSVLGDIWPHRTI